MLHRTQITDPLTGAVFNDYDTVLPENLLGTETDDTKFDYVTQVCDECVEEHGIADGLFRGVGSGWCGVVGCENEAPHIYLFMIEGPPLEEPDEIPRERATSTTAPRRPTPPKASAPESPPRLLGLR